MIPDSYLDTWALADLDEDVRIDAEQYGIKGNRLYRGPIEAAIELTKCPFCGEYLLDDDTPPCEHCVVIFSHEHEIEYISSWLEANINGPIHHVIDLDKTVLDEMHIVITDEDAPNGDGITGGWVESPPVHG